MPSLKIGYLNPLDIKCLVEVNDSKSFDLGEHDNKRGVIISNFDATSVLLRVRTKHSADSVKIPLGEKVLSGIIALIDMFGSETRSFIEIPYDYDNLYEISGLCDRSEILIVLHATGENMQDVSLSVKAEQCEVQIKNQECSVDYVRLKRIRHKQLIVSIVLMAILVLFLTIVSVITGNVAVILITLAIAFLCVTILLYWRNKWKNVMKKLIGQ